MPSSYIVWAPSKKWKASDLNGQSIELDGSGVGTLTAYESDTKGLAVDLEIADEREAPARIGFVKMHLMASEVERIEPHPLDGGPRYVLRNLS